MEETKDGVKDVIVEDEDPSQLIAVAPVVKEEGAILPTVSDGEEEIIIEKHEVVIKDDVEVVKEAGDILQPVVILDAQSIATTAAGEKFSKAFDHFAKKGFKVVVFLPKSMVVKKVKDASDEVKAAMKLTMKKLPCTGDNPWGLDKWEVGTLNIAVWLHSGRCYF